MCTASRMASTAAALTGLPAKAPLRSTMCRYSKPCSSKLRACAAESVLNTVTSAISPWRSRTHCPSLRSMAGNRIMSAYRLISTSSTRIYYRLDEGDYDAGGNSVEAAFNAEEQENAAEDKGENADLEQDQIADEWSPVLEIDLAQGIDFHA